MNDFEIVILKPISLWKSTNEFVKICLEIIEVVFSESRSCREQIIKTIGKYHYKQWVTEREKWETRIL